MEIGPWPGMEHRGAGQFSAENSETELIPAKIIRIGDPEERKKEKRKELMLW
jgi:hypothetical protein